MTETGADQGHTEALQPMSELDGDQTLIPQREPWSWMEAFILIQFLSPAIMMFPGSQVIRMPVRVLPYFFSVIMFAVLFQRRNLFKSLQNRAPASGWMIAVMVVLCLNLFHPDTIAKSGIAQVAFQLTIIGPLFWTVFEPVSKSRLMRILWLCLFCNGLSAIVGALQVYFPQYFLPIGFSGGLSESYLSSLYYEGVNGRMILRPPGLSDIPGGAVHGAVFSSFLALFFATQKGVSMTRRILLILLLFVAFFTLYLTQVRSVFLILIGTIAVLVLLRLRSGEGGRGIGIILLAVVAIAYSFKMAVNIGGEVVSTRYLDLAETGILESFQQNRGQFLKYTLDHVLWEYPLGAGLGRWGMMNNYFGGGTSISSLWAEIQLTGWLFDGGIPLCFCYIGGLLASFIMVFRISKGHPDPVLVIAAQAVFCLNMITAVRLFAGPSFNAQNGMIFWFLYGLLISSAHSTAEEPFIQDDSIPHGGSD